ncbi:MAG: hypothetical protein Q9214_001991, partial [Letrouitia sp. 1 TL-2023]
MGYDQNSSEAIFVSKDGHCPAFVAKSGGNQLIRRLLLCFAVGLLFLGLFFGKPSISFLNVQYGKTSDYPPRHPKHPHVERCPQVDPLSPSTTDALRQMDEYLKSDDYAKFSAGLLSEAVQYRTVSYDNMSDPDFPLDDPLYDPFKHFYKFISQNFPKS